MSKTFDEAELVSRALALEHVARGDDPPSETIMQAIYELQTGGEISVKAAMGKGAWDSANSRLADFGDAVRAIKKSRKSGAELFRSEWLSSLGKLSLVPTEFSDYELKWRLVGDLTDLRPVLAFVLTLLLNPRKEFSGSLGHCEFEPCGKFFLAARSKAGGRPRIKYCSEEHMLEAHNAGAVKRVQQHRARKARRGK